MAIKLERNFHLTVPILQYEAMIYKKMRGQEGVPRIYWYGVDGDFRAMAMSIHGPNLRKLCDFSGGKFCIDTVCSIGVQLLQRLENLHNHDFLYRNMMPEHVIIGRGKKSNILYLVDMSKTKRFISHKTGKHIPKRLYKRKLPTVDSNVTYMPYREHEGKSSSRRDDLEGLGLMMIKFLKGCKCMLPWELEKPDLPFVSFKDA